MSNPIETRLQELDIVLPEAAAPAANYVSYVISGNMLYISGQVGIDPDTAQIVGPGFAEQAHQALKNVRALVENAGFSMQDIIKITVFLTRLEDFSELNAIYREYFSEPYPTRSTVGISLQPASLLIEIEGVAIRREG